MLAYVLAVVMVLSVSQAALASTVSVVPPNQTVAKAPVTQFKVGLPSVLPTTNGHPAVGTVFAIQSYMAVVVAPIQLERTRA